MGAAIKVQILTQFDRRLNSCIFDVGILVGVAR